MRPKLRRSTLEKLLQVSDIDALSGAELLELFREDINTNHRPSDLVYEDPRSGERVVYSTARSVRPHDYPVEQTEAAVDEEGCIICQGKTTGVVDVAELSEGFTFINKNLYPAFYPFDSSGSSGLHLLQWTSSCHDVDWHNMNPEDAGIVMSRLAVLERSLLSTTLPGQGVDAERFVSIIKNYGAVVGSSLKHGHQQIMLTNVQPGSAKLQRAFLRERGETFADFMVRENPEELIVQDYGPALLVVPGFMRRPYVMMLFIKDTQKAYIHELTPDETSAVARGWCDATRGYHDLMPRIGKEVAYNILTYNGPGAGLYFEFLPYTQTLGGLERMGLYICTELPKVAARRLRAIVSDGEAMT